MLVKPLKRKYLPNHIGSLTKYEGCWMPRKDGSSLRPSQRSAVIFVAHQLKMKALQHFEGSVTIYPNDTALYSTGTSATQT